MKQSIDFYTRSLDCVHCGLCLEACPTYGVLGLETDSPRGRIYLMRALAEGRIDDPEAIRPHLDQCLDCRACETACPSGVRYGRILETVKSEIEEKKPKRGFKASLTRFLLARMVAHQGRLRAFFRFARFAEVVGLRRLARLLGLLPASMDALVPHVPGAAERRPIRGTFRPDGPARGRVALFTGCVMEQVFGRINAQTRDLLVQNGFEVVSPDTQACCGALLIHNGQEREARTLAARNVAAFADFDHVITNSAGCGAALRDYGDLLGTAEAEDLARRCVDVTAFLAEQGLTATPARRDVTVAYDAPCHLCHAQGVRTAPTDLLAQVPGLRLAPNPRAEDCCGSAGIYNLLQPDIARAIGEKKAEDLATTGADLVATGNPGCMMQIGAHLRARGSTQRVVHPVELLLPNPPS
jgi:glycolate oxidase iron-sulfur subunit